MDFCGSFFFLKLYCIQVKGAMIENCVFMLTGNISIFNSNLLRHYDENGKFPSLLFE